MVACSRQNNAQSEGGICAMVNVRFCVAGRWNRSAILRRAARIGQPAGATAGGDCPCTIVDVFAAGQGNFATGRRNIAGQADIIACAARGPNQHIAARADCTGTERITAVQSNIVASGDGYGAEVIRSISKSRVASAGIEC